jgi:endonuclease YncB( thermonuclease family)
MAFASTLDYVYSEWVDRALYLSPYTRVFFDSEYLPLYYELRGNYITSNGITVGTFETQFANDKSVVDEIVGRIYVAYGAKNIADYEKALKFSKISPTLTGDELIQFKYWSFVSEFKKSFPNVYWVVTHMSAILTVLGALQIGQFSLSKQQLFGTWIASLSENKDLLISYCEGTKRMANFNDVSLVPFFWVPFQPALKLFDAGMLDAAYAYCSIAQSFKYIGQYKLTAIIESIGVSESILSFLPDNVDKITFPTIHLPENAKVGDIVEIEISRCLDRSSDLSTLQKVTGTVVDVHDGDTFTLSDGTKIRILPINAPELRNPDGSVNPAGTISQKALSDLILNQEINYYVDPSSPEDQYGRVLAYVFLADVNIGTLMMAQGFAVLYYTTNSWFQTDVVEVDDKYTSLTTITEFYDEEYLRFLLTETFYRETNIKIPNYFIPFAAQPGDIVCLRVQMSNKLSFNSLAVCEDADHVYLYIEPDELYYISVDLPFLDTLIASPCDKRIRVGIRLYAVCFDEIAEGDIKTIYDRYEDGFAVFIVLDADNNPTEYEIRVPDGGETVTPDTIIIDDFEDGNNGPPKWSVSGSLNWASVGNSHSGKYAIGVIGNNAGSAYLYQDITVPAGGGTLEFYIEIGSSPWQFVYFYIDSVLKNAWLHNGWVIASFPVTEGVHEIKFDYQATINAYNFVIIDDIVLQTSKTVTNKNLLPSNISIGDYVIFTFKEILPYIIFNVFITALDGIWAYVQTTDKIAPISFVFPQSLIPFPIAVGDIIGIQIGKDIGDYYIADFQARLGNNATQIANFIQMPENAGDLPIDIPLKIVKDIVQDPSEHNDLNKLQVGDISYFKIIDKSFVNTFKAYLYNMDHDNGFWYVLPGETIELTIPNIIPIIFIGDKKYSEYPVITLSIKKLKTTSSYSSVQLVEVIETDADYTKIKFLDPKFSDAELTIPTGLFSWEPAVGDQGIFSMNYYAESTLNIFYVNEEIAVGDTVSHLRHLTRNVVVDGVKERILLDYPVDKMPKYAKRFDVVKLKIVRFGYTYDPTWVYTVVRSLDDGTGKAELQRTDDDTYIYVPNILLPVGVKEGYYLYLRLVGTNYAETYCEAKFIDYSGDLTSCDVEVEPEYFYKFELPVKYIYPTALINSILGFHFIIQPTDWNLYIYSGFRRAELPLAFNYDLPIYETQLRFVYSLETKQIINDINFHYYLLTATTSVLINLPFSYWMGYYDIVKRFEYNFSNVFIEVAKDFNYNLLTGSNSVITNLPIAFDLNSGSIAYIIPIKYYLDVPTKTIEKDFVYNIDVILKTTESSLYYYLNSKTKSVEVGISYSIVGYPVQKTIDFYYSLFTKTTSIIRSITFVYLLDVKYLSLIFDINYKLLTKTNSVIHDLQFEYYFYSNTKSFELSISYHFTLCLTERIIPFVYSFKAESLVKK